MQVEGQLAAFAEQVGASAPQAAAACRAALAGDAGEASSPATHSVRLSARRSYRVPDHASEGGFIELRLRAASHTLLACMPARSNPSLSACVGVGSDVSRPSEWGNRIVVCRR